ncbi:8534_t:CDS:2 [Entrophospora sp. SA101]|nr:8534_t:CDS:2 [Entrophospora sp. SA101]
MSNFNKKNQDEEDVEETSPISSQDALLAVEKIIHLELAECRIDLSCECTQVHNEWFKSNQKEVCSIVEKWVIWPSSCKKFHYSLLDEEEEISQATAN